MLREPIDIEALVFWAFADQEVERAVDADADAVIVAMAVTSLPEPHRRLVEHFARTGRAPPWQPVQEGTVVFLDRLRLARLAYREWIRALVVLRCTIAGELQGYRVTGPEAPQEPWRESA